MKIVMTKNGTYIINLNIKIIHFIMNNDYYPIIRH